MEGKSPIHGAALPEYPTPPQAKNRIKSSGCLIPTHPKMIETRKEIMNKAGVKSGSDLYNMTKAQTV